MSSTTLSESQIRQQTSNQISTHESIRIKDEGNNLMNWPWTIASKTTTIVNNDSKPYKSSEIDIEKLLKVENMINVISCRHIASDTKILDIFATWTHYFCPYLPPITASQSVLDECFNTVVDEPLNFNIFVHELTINRSIKAYVVDSLKRYHALNDIMAETPKFRDLKIKDSSTQATESIQQLQNVAHIITPRMLLISTIESMAYVSQRYLCNFIKKNDLPIPLSYYTYSSSSNAIEYKINFNTLAEVLCITHDRVMLQIGSPSACGLGKSTFLRYIFHDKRKESTTTTGPSILRSGCVDVLFGTTQFENTAQSYVIFDLHGTVQQEVNHTLIHAIQQYSSLQILYVYEHDLEKHPNFLPYMINGVESVPTVVIIFDSQYDAGSTLSTSNHEIVEKFQQHYKHEDWSHVQWFSAPTNVSSSYDFDNKDFYEACRDQRLHKSFKFTLNTLEPLISVRQQLFHSVFLMQTFFLLLKQGNCEFIPRDCFFAVEPTLEQLFKDLSDTRENLLIVTPVSYLKSKIDGCRKKLLEDWGTSKAEVETEKSQLEEKLKNITETSPHTQFFLELLLKRSYIELLIVEAFFERWRSRFQPELQKQMTAAKHDAMQLMSPIKRLEANLADAHKRLTDTQKRQEDILKKDDKTGVNNIHNEIVAIRNEIVAIRNEIDPIKDRYAISQRNIDELERKLQNIDLTIGLFVDEIICLCEEDKIHIIAFFSETILDDLGKCLHTLMERGIALHILRGRPLCCSSRLLRICLQYTKMKTSPYVLTVVGEQSSAKSSLLNTTFGCNFRVSAGRCTLGMYMSIVRWKSQTIVILDTEGLLSVEEANSIFDNQMITMAMLSSHLVLINHKGEFSTTLSDLIGMSFYAKLQIRSPIRPKVLFVLRDQNDTSDEAKSIFLKQLAQLKKKLQDDSQFLKSSIDDELDMSAENVVLLSNAISKDVDSKLNIAQRWRNKTFPLEINVLRHTIFHSMAPAKKQAVFEDIDDMYMKIVSSWSAIDTLGPKLLACKTLYELAITNEVRDIANSITPTINSRFYDEAQQLICQILENVANRCTEIKSSNDFANENENFAPLLHKLYEKHLNQAYAEFDEETDRSCYLAEIKQKVKKIIEPTLHFTKQQTRKQFSERLHSIIQRALVESVERNLISDAQTELDQNKLQDINKFYKELQIKFSKLIEECKIKINKLSDTPDTITRTILNIYCSLLDRRAANKDPNEIHNLLGRMDVQEYEKNILVLEKCHRELEPFLQQRKDSLFTRVGGKLGICTRELDEMWSKKKQYARWLQKDMGAVKSQNILLGLCHVVIPKLEHDVRKLVDEIKLEYSDPKTVDLIVSYIENTHRMNEIHCYYGYLNWTALVGDLAVIALHCFIKNTIKRVTCEKDTKIQEAVTALETLRDQIIKQVESRKNSQEQGKNLANNIGKHIFTDIQRLLHATIAKDVEADIAKSEYIVHDKLQKEAYERSFEQGNKENIIKYIDDINRYFLELSLEKVKMKFMIAINTHTHNIQELFTEMLYAANEAVQTHDCKDISSINNIIKKNIMELDKIKSLINTDKTQSFTLPYCMQLPVDDSSNFKYGFKDILLFLKEIPKQSSTIMSELRTQAFDRCKQTIKQRLGCEARCPDCGAKCSIAGEHKQERIQRLPENCKCSKEKCNCKKDWFYDIAHATEHHIASCFHGGKWNHVNTPVLHMCYQQWTTTGKVISESETIFPKRLYFNKKQSAWFNNLEELSTTAADCDKKHLSEESRSQRRAWMLVRRFLIIKYGMTDYSVRDYEKWGYPTIEDSEQLAINFKPQWVDDSIDWDKEKY